jgi:predicted secreted protein
MAHGSPPTAESEAMLGYGSHFQIETGSPADFVDLGEVFDITPPSSEVDQVDVTHMQSPGRRREFIDGLIDSGECSFEMNYIPGSVADLALLDILNTPVGESRRRTCRIIYPNSVTDTFSANLMNYEPTVPTDDKMTATVTFRVTGAITRGSV